MLIISKLQANGLLDLYKDSKKYNLHSKEVTQKMKTTVNKYQVMKTFKAIKTDSNPKNHKAQQAHIQPQALNHKNKNN